MTRIRTSGDCQQATGEDGRMEVQEASSAWSKQEAIYLGWGRAEMPGPAGTSTAVRKRNCLGGLPLLGSHPDGQPEAEYGLFAIGTGEFDGHNNQRRRRIQTGTGSRASRNIHDAVGGSATDGSGTGLSGSRQSLTGGGGSAIFRTGTSRTGSGGNTTQAEVRTEGFI